MPGAFGRMLGADGGRRITQRASGGLAVTLGRGARMRFGVPLWSATRRRGGAESADGLIAFAVAAHSWSLDDAVWVAVDNNVALRATGPGIGQPARFQVDSTAVASRFGAINANCPVTGRAPRW